MNTEHLRREMDLRIEAAQIEVRSIGEQLTAAYAKLNRVIAARAELDRTRIKCDICHDYFEPERLPAHVEECKAEQAAGLGVR